MSAIRKRAAAIAAPLGLVFLSAAVAAPQPARNQDLLLNAQAGYQSLMKEARSRYSDHLNALEKRLNAYRKRNGLTLYSAIIVMDPIKADVGLALSLPPVMVGQAMLMQRGVLSYPMLTDVFTHYMIGGTSDLAGRKTYSQDPHALFGIFEDGRKSPCTVIPAPDDNVPAALEIAGLSQTQAIEFANRHEGSHCLDDVYYTRQFDTGVYQSFQLENPASTLGHADAMDAYTTMHKAEAFADTMALGELIREGRDVSMIGRIADWRRRKADNLVHMTAPVLQGLQKEISRIGLNGFRALDEKAARRLYYKTVEAYALNPGRLQKLLSYKAADETEQTAMQAKATLNEELAKTLDFASALAGPADADALAAAFASIMGGAGKDTKALVREKHVQTVISKWDAMVALRGDALAADHKITPETLVRAYMRMRHSLALQVEAGGHDADIAFAKAAALKTAFIDGLAKQDFITLNKTRGIRPQMPERLN